MDMLKPNRRIEVRTIHTEATMIMERQSTVIFKKDTHVVYTIAKYV